jgi:hypothetical protein
MPTPPGPTFTSAGAQGELEMTTSSEQQIIDNAHLRAGEIIDQIGDECDQIEPGDEQKSDSFYATVFSLWAHCTQILAQGGWTESELSRDLSWHCSTKAKEENGGETLN